MRRTAKNAVQPRTAAPHFMNYNFLYALVRRHPPLLLHGILKRLAGLEDGDGGSGDLAGFLGFGVAAHAGFALLRLKTAEANQLDRRKAEYQPKHII